MTALRTPDGTTAAWRSEMEKVIHDSHVHLLPHYLREDGQVISKVLLSEVRHAIMSMKNRTSTDDPDRIKPEHPKCLPSVLMNTAARLFTRYLSDFNVPKQWKTSKTVMLCKKGDTQNIGNYRPICLLSAIYELFTTVILNKAERKLDEGQPCEQSGFPKGFSTIDHIHTVSKLIEVSRDYKMPLCFTFIDLKKAFDTVETELVMEQLPFFSFPFYIDAIIDLKRGIRQGDTIPPKMFSATLDSTIRGLEWDNMEVKVDGRNLHHLRFGER
ncbi:hypothetical protein RB195_002578 [Necator americanus]|uniref:Reverse transcriptase domain-containing protein n=1 Tax=Necator americanus TaxID=51031 RepID=A0ABR1DJP3_NECAM